MGPTPCWKRTLALLLVVNYATAFVAPVVKLHKRYAPHQQHHASRSGDQDTPSWRYEVDDLIKAVSPWGSLVEAEIIGTDLGKFRVWRGITTG